MPSRARIRARSPWQARGWGAATVCGAFIVLAACGDEPCDPEPPALTPPEVTTACGQLLFERPADPAARGPWPVGARTVGIGRLRAEVWYPARLGSESCGPPTVYDLREHLPDDEAAKLTDASNPTQPCDCFRDVPLDEAHGPYPVALFVHGTGGFRSLSLSVQTHWASRGFVVIAADHPGITLRDLFNTLLGDPVSGELDQTGDARAIVAALATPSGDLGFLAGHLDPSRVGIAGHSAGGVAIAGLGDLARVLLPMCADGTVAADTLAQSVIIGGLVDAVVPFDRQASGYDSSPKPRRLVGVSGAGHSLPTDLCLIGADRGGLFRIAADAGITLAELFETLGTNGCAADNLDATRGNDLVKALSTAVLEEELTCSADGARAAAAFPAGYPEVGVYLADW